MNEIVNKILFAGDKCLPTIDLTLKQLGEGGGGGLN